MATAPSIIRTTQRGFVPDRVLPPAVWDATRESAGRASRTRSWTTTTVPLARVATSVQTLPRIEATGGAEHPIRSWASSRATLDRAHQRGLDRGVGPRLPLILDRPTAGRRVGFVHYVPVESAEISRCAVAGSLG
jgi:hypothetical protein